jgi:ABC-type sugar transport system substrate-binding protein
MGGWLRQPAREFMEKLLPTVGRIDAVFAENDEMALGVVDALRLWRRQAETFVVGLDGQYEALRRIAQGSPLVMTIKSEWDSGAAVDVAVAAARGLEVPRRIVLEAPAIDQTNVEEFLGDNVRIW